MTTFTDKTGRWESVTDKTTRDAMTDFMEKYELSDAVTITDVMHDGTYYVWAGDLNGREFTLTQHAPLAGDYQHDVHHDTYGTTSQRQLDLADMAAESNWDY